MTAAAGTLGVNAAHALRREYTARVHAGPVASSHTHHSCIPCYHHVELVYVLIVAN